MGHGTAHAERLALAATLAATEPAAPTLCTGWDAAMLAAHIVLRDRRPDLQVGMLVKPLGERLGVAQRRLAGHTPWSELVERVREGPRWHPTALTLVDDLTNTVEFAVHHEDVRRAAAGWEPRQLSPELSAGIWSSLKTVGKLATRSMKVPLVIADPAGNRAVLRKGAEPVVVTGEPIELALFLTGRRGVARVELTGPPAAVVAVQQTSTGM